MRKNYQTYQEDSHNSKAKRGEKAGAQAKSKVNAVQNKREPKVGLSGGKAPVQRYQQHFNQCCHFAH